MLAGQLLHARQRVQAYAAIIRAPSELIGSLGKENAGAGSSVQLEGASDILIER